jgi:peptide/nickel transport system ATP-binding protein
MALMLITHDLAVVAGLADRVAVMKDGGSSRRARRRASSHAAHHPYTRA